MKRQRSVKHDQLLHEKKTDYERHHELFNFAKSVLDLEAEISDKSSIPDSITVNNNDGLQLSGLPDAYGHIEHCNANLAINQIHDDSLKIPHSVNDQGTVIREVEGKWSIDQKHCIYSPQSSDCNPINNIQLSRVYFSQKTYDESFEQAPNHIDTNMLTKRGYDEHPPILSSKRRKVTFKDIVGKQYVTNNTRRHTSSTSDNAKSNLKGLFQKSTNLSRNSNISANHYLYFLPKRRKLLDSNNTKYDCKQICLNHISDIHRFQVQERTNSLTNINLQTHLIYDNDEDDDDEEDKEQEGVETQMQVVLDSNGRVQVTNALPYKTGLKSKGITTTTDHRKSSSDTLSTQANYTHRKASLYTDSEPTRSQTDHGRFLSSERELGFADRREKKRIGEGDHRSAFKAYTPHSALQIHNHNNEEHSRRLAGLNDYKALEDSKDIFIEREGLNYKLPYDVYQREPSVNPSHYILPKLIQTKEYDNTDSEHCIDNIDNNQHENHNKVEGFNGMYDVSVNEHVHKVTLRGTLPVTHSEVSQSAQNMLYMDPENAHSPNSYITRYSIPNDMNQIKEERNQEIASNIRLARAPINNEGTYSSIYMCKTKSPDWCEVRKNESIADVEFVKSDETAKNAYITRHLVDAHGEPFIAVYPAYDNDMGENLQSVKEMERDDCSIMKNTYVSHRLAPDKRSLCHVYKTTGGNITTNDSHANLQHKLQKTPSTNQHNQISKTPCTGSKQFVTSTKSVFQVCNVDDSKPYPYCIGRPQTGGHTGLFQQNEKRIQVERRDSIDQDPLYYNRDYRIVTHNIVNDQSDDNNDDDDGNTVDLSYKHSKLKYGTTASTKQTEHLHCNYRHRQNATAPTNGDEPLRYKLVDYQTTRRTTTASDDRNIDDIEDVADQYNARPAYCHQQNESVENCKVEHLTRKYAPAIVNNDNSKDDEEEPVSRHCHLNNVAFSNNYKSNDQKEQRYKYASFTTTFSKSNDQKELLYKHNNQIKTPSPSSSTKANNANAELKDDIKYTCKSITTTTGKANRNKQSYKSKPVATTANIKDDSKNKDFLSTSTSSKDTDEKEEQRYKCEWPACSKSFRHYSFLVLHRRIHSGERPYICTWEGCKKQFRRSDDYQRHYRVHTGVRPFPCEICGKSFKRSDHRLFHYRAIHNLYK